MGECTWGNNTFGVGGTEEDNEGDTSVLHASDIDPMDHETHPAREREQRERSLLFFVCLCTTHRRPGTMRWLDASGFLATKAETPPTPF